MSPLPDALRKLSSLAALLAIPMSWICLGHFCMGGHMAHPPYAWYSYANDWIWPLLFLVSVVSSAFSNYDERSVFIGLALTTSVLNALCLAPYSLISSMLLAMACIRQFSWSGRGTTSQPIGSKEPAPNTTEPSQ